LILFAGRLTHVKGADLLLSALAQLKRSDYFCLIAGDGPDGRLLFDVEVKDIPVIAAENWQTAAMARAPCFTIECSLQLDAASLIGAPRFYLERRGFWPGAVGVAAMANRVDFDLVLCLVNAVDDPVGSTAGGVVAVEWLVQRLACPVGIHGDRAVDRFHGGKSDLQGEVLPDVAPGPPGQEHAIGLAGRGVGRHVGDVGAVGALAVTNVDCAACDIQVETLGLMTSSENTISRDVP